MSNTASHRLALVKAYEQLIVEHSLNREAYFLNFMFNQLHGSLATKMTIMAREIERFHGILSRHVARRPKSSAESWLRPIILACHDFPVFKYSNETRLYQREVNDGLHANAIALVPPPHKPGMPRFIDSWFSGSAVSRLSVPLDEHLNEKKRIYLNERLHRIHVTPITYGTMTDYALKMFKRGRVDGDSIQLLH